MDFYEAAVSESSTKADKKGRERELTAECVKDLVLSAQSHSMVAGGFEVMS